MADKNTTVSFFYGAKDGIQAKLDDGIITPSDFVVTKEDELVFINKNKEQRTLGSSKTKAPIIVNMGEGASIGGIQNGATIEAGTSLDEFITQLLVKQIPATYTTPSAGLTSKRGGSTPGDYEVGTTVAPQLTATFNKGDAGNLTMMEIFKNGSEKIAGQNQSPFDYTVPGFKITDGKTAFTAKATYEEGVIKNDNLGKPSPNGHILAGTTRASNEIAYYGKRRMFVLSAAGEVPELTSANIRKGSNLVNKLGVAAGYSFRLTIPTGASYALIAYPASIRDLTSCKYVEQSNTEMKNNFKKQSNIQIEGAEGAAGVDYKVFVYTMSNPAAAPMNFDVTI